MDRRRSPRVQTSRPATLTLLSEPVLEFAVMVEDLSGGGARVRLEVVESVSAVTAGSVIQLVTEDELYLGEVMYCSRIKGQTHAGLALRHSLTHVKDLANLMQRLIPSHHCAWRTSPTE